MMSFPRKKFFNTKTYFETDWDELQNNIGNYYDNLLGLMGGDISTILSDYLTSAHKDSATPHPNLTLDNVGQGLSWIKLTLIEYQAFLLGFYDFTLTGPNLTLGINHSITDYFFAQGADPDGANIHAHSFFSDGRPLYSLCWSSGWIRIPTYSSYGNHTHNIGFRPDFGLLAVALSDPTGQPQEFICTEGRALVVRPGEPPSYATWNDALFNIFNQSYEHLWFRLQLFVVT